MDSAYDTLAGGLPHSDTHGSTPARGSPWLFAACHVLHRLLVPRHPPNALLILDRCDVAPKSRVHHAQKPSSVAVVCVATVRRFRKYLFRTQQDLLELFRRRLRDHRQTSDKILHNASEPSPPTVGAPSSQTAIPGQTIRPNDGSAVRGHASAISQTTAAGA
jgi:hypothetical protein